MAATDYVIVKGLDNAYFCKGDRRVFCESEIIGLFESFLRKWCDEHDGEDTVVITNEDGKTVFEAILLDKEQRRVNNT